MKLAETASVFATISAAPAAPPINPLGDVISDSFQSNVTLLKVHLNASSTGHSYGHIIINE
jgi:hypothetical protein